MKISGKLMLFLYASMMIYFLLSVEVMMNK